MYEPRPSTLPPAVPARKQSRSWTAFAPVGWVALVLIAGPFALILLFRFVPPPITPLMAIRFVQGFAPHRQWVDYADIAPALSHAVIASEDNLFCEETLGFDIPALRGQIEAWRNGARPRGASTITMQTAKNLLLWPGRDPVRKLIEAWLTPQVALLWPKRRVLEVYLNIVEFGPGIYGAEAASRWFFRKPAAELSPREAAQLASVLPRPLVWAASPAGLYVRERAAAIERRVAQIRPLLACGE
jgi:monofunctional biosynthetic peptidoglycan transglycosylase